MGIWMSWHFRGSDLKRMTPPALGLPVIDFAWRRGNLNCPQGVTNLRFFPCRRVNRAQLILKLQAYMTQLQFSQTQKNKCLRLARDWFANGI